MFELEIYCRYNLIWTVIRGTIGLIIKGFLFLLSFYIPLSYLKIHVSPLMFITESEFRSLVPSF